MSTLCPVCGASGTSDAPRIPPNEPVRVVDGADTWLVACPVHDAADVAAALAGFENAQGQPLVEVLA